MHVLRHNPQLHEISVERGEKEFSWRIERCPSGPRRVVSDLDLGSVVLRLLAVPVPVVSVSARPSVVSLHERGGPVRAAGSNSLISAEPAVSSEFAAVPTPSVGKVL